MVDFGVGDAPQALASDAVWSWGAASTAHFAKSLLEVVPFEIYWQIGALEPSR